MAAEKQRYNRDITTAHGDKQTTTKRTPEVTTQTQQEVSGFYNPDGTPNAGAEREFNIQKRAIAPSYGVNPDTGRVEHRFVSDILGVDPDIMRRKRAEEQRLNQSKQKESGLYNALAVLGDMITTAGGGNVWERKPDNHAKEAHDDNIKLQKEQNAEDIANATKLRAAEKQYAAAVQKIRNSVGKAYGTKISRTVKSGGDTIQTTTQENDRTTGYTEGRGATVGGGSTSRSGGSGAGGNRYLMNIRDTEANKIHSYELTKGQFDAVTGILKAHYTSLIQSEDREYAKRITDVLKKAHILIGYEKDRKTPIFDYNMMLHNGAYYDLTDAIAHKIEEETGNKVTFTRHQNSRAFHLSTDNGADSSTTAPRGGM